MKKESDAVDVSASLHRDGSVITAVTLADLAKPDRLYAAMGCKTAVGMPFKDIATSDSVFLRQAPAADQTTERTALRRLQESGVGVLVPAQELAKNAVPNAIAVIKLKDVQVGAATLPAICLVRSALGALFCPHMLVPPP